MQDYLYRAGSDVKWMFIVTSGEVKERVSWSLSSVATSAPSSVSVSTSSSSSSSMTTAATDAAMRALFMRSAKKNPERVVNVEMLLVGPGDIVGELPIATSRRTAPFDIKAVTDVQVLAIDRRFLENVILSASREQKPAVHATVRRLRKIARDREDWRQQRIACGIAYPNAPVTMCVGESL
jgi:CRP-like cAMP-binding protein